MIKSTLANGAGGASRRAILLVEDNDALREALQYTLERMGHLVHDAPSGPEALEVADKVNINKLDLVISDLVMPGMNALELYEAMQVASYGGKMLVITGYPMPHTGMTLAERPGVQWAEKPIGVDALRDLVSQMLEE